MNTRSSQLLTVAGLGIGGFLLYSWFNKAKAAGYVPSTALPAGSVPYTPAALNAAVPGVSFAPSTIQPGILTSTLTAVPAVTSAQVSAANQFWSTLTPVVPLASGYITFPSGSQAAAATFGAGNTAMDGNGNLYVLWGGQVYQLGSQDSAGNYPAIQVNAVGGSPGVPATANTQSDFSWLLTS